MKTKASWEHSEVRPMAGKSPGRRMGTPGHFLTVLSLLILLTLLVPLAPAQAAPSLTASQAGPVPRFEPGPCTFKIPQNATIQEGTDFRCGVLIVPERYEDPGGPTIQLGVVVVKAATSSTAPDPVVFAQGGPGGSTIDYYTNVLFSSRIRRNRDLVLFDQRGTLYAKPNLFCQEIFDENVKDLPLNLKAEEINQRQRVAALACRERLIQDGVNLDAYDSVENANDIESLRVAMGYKQINLYGVSYGTLLALHAMRQNPGGLRSVIIDSVVPPTVNFNFDAPRSEDRAFKELWKACQEDPGCNESYPNLEKFFFDLVAQLNQKPIIIHITDSETGKTHDALINGDGLSNALFQMLYASELIPLLPKMIHNVAAGRYTFLERVMSLIVFDRTVSYGMYYSVVCAEGGTNDPSQLSYSDIRPELAKDADTNNRSLVQLCTNWKVQPLAPEDDSAVQSDIPTLVFNGRFDPITPPAYGQEAARTLTRNYLFVFPNTGHGALSTSECVDSIFLEFLANPDTAPDGSCINQLPAIQFMTSKTVIDLPIVIRFLSAEQGVLPGMVIFGIGLLGLLSAALIFPLLWLVRILRSKEGRATPVLAHLAPWLPVLNAGVLIAFAVAFLVAIFQLATQNEPSYLFGIPVKYGPLLVLPLFSLLLSLLTVVLSAAGWYGKYWSVGRKIYYSLLSVSSLITLVMLGVWGFLTALLG